MLILTRRLLQICALTAINATAQAATIGFDDLAGGQNDPFYFHTEAGFIVFPAGGEPWVQNIVYGNPAPSVIFHRPRGAPELWAGMFIRSGDGSDFTFAAVDLYSSVTAIPYRFLAYDEGMPVFDFTATMPNTFGQFKTADNPYGDIAIDLLYIELANPFVAVGGNPVGFDNVVVSVVRAVPEPATSGLLLIMAAGIFSLRLLRARARENVT
jgi:hypothetical protein